MEWWGPSVTFEFIDRADALTILATSVRRRGDLIFPGALGLFSFVALCFHGNWLAIFGPAIFAVFLFVSWFSDSTTELRVTQNELTSRTSSEWNSTSASIRWAEVRGLQYGGGGEDEPKGLYAKKSFWSSTCLLPNINKEQTIKIINAIYRKFPNPKMAGDTDASSWPLRLRDTMTKLGLSGKDR